MLSLLVYGSGGCLALVISESWGLLIGLWQAKYHPKYLGPEVLWICF